MSRADDLAPLLRQAGGDVGFRQGTVVTWASDGTNAVDVGGTRLVNLPALNIGDYVVLQPGDVVGLLRFKTTFFILGRIQLPGPPDPDRATVAFDVATGFDAGVTLTPSYAILASCTLDVPEWADEALVTATSTVSAQNTAAQTDLAMCKTEINGLNGATMLTTVGAGDRGAISTTATFLITDPPASILCTAQGQTNSTFSQTWTGDVFTAAYINATAIYRRTS